MEKLRTMRTFGATVEIIPSPSGQITTDLIPSMVRRTKEIAASDDKYYLTEQFNNRDALVGYENIGRELLEQVPDGIDAFCGAVGGAGMLMGVSRVPRAKWPGTKVVVLDVKVSLRRGNISPYERYWNAPGVIEWQINCRKVELEVGFES
ncbi:pyridoxal phosphate-dependent enzyme, beta subunit [Aspergillus udagawae]|nr:pyridoxal phosphate-dependent enzyme, beta subunit [Aspergillus udagawae]